MSDRKNQPVPGAPELVARASPPSKGSDRSFGIVFAAVFVIISAWPLFSGGQVRWWSLAVSAAFAIVALVRPGLLAPLNAVWMRFGLLLNRIVSPIALLLVYCLAVLPTGWLMRLFGKDPLRRHIDTQVGSYWIERTPPGRPDGQMKKQF